MPCRHNRNPFECLVYLIILTQIISTLTIRSHNNIKCIKIQGHSNEVLVKKASKRKSANAEQISREQKTGHNLTHDSSHPFYAKRIIFALRKIMQQMDFHSRRLDKHYGITIPQIVCLYEIYEKGAVTLSVLSQKVHLATSTLVGIIDRLEEKGFVKRTRNTEDRRVIFIDITDKGIKFVRTSPHLLHNRLEQYLKLLNEGEQIIIANSLDILVEILNSDDVKIDE